MSDYVSPNMNDRPDGVEIDTVVLHYTGMKTVDEALVRLCDPESQVSAHYLIQESGEIIPLVPEEKRAWHAGESAWRGRQNVNDFSIGIELVNPGHEYGYRPFSEAQMDSLIRLLEELFYRHPIEVRNVVGHSDIAPMRKEDPGELFNWELLASYNLAIWPDMPRECQQEDILKPGASGDDVKNLQRNLKKIGYNIEITSEFDLQTCYVVIAFQRHFTPTKIGDIWHQEAQTALEQLLLQC